ncbi:MAG: DUF1667 domain-containing protein [FCB group bacterium]|nr:DUF1667 domain-containing protein [FCB group bacterium]
MTDTLPKDMICIVCPVGCKMTLEPEGKGYRVSGHQCKRGEDYAVEEYTNPTRMLTTTVRICHPRYRRLPVHSSGPLPKGLLFRAMEVINAYSAKAPVTTGQVLIADILETGIDICSSRDMEEK